MSSDSVARLGEAELERLAEATWRAVAHVEPALSFADFLELPFSVGDLIQAFPSVAKAAGLRAAETATAGGVARRGKIDYDALIAGVVANLGWSWDEALDRLTVPRFLALQAEWRRHPPAHWLVAAALKYQPPGEPAGAAPADGRRAERPRSRTGRCDKDRP